mmetsp:Transcript_15637/g.26086  ORF Transcript_15637/g.26086 Transcript_15637/m.26086 type:complete len:126 (-) Transcript_15637:61-438(-)
MNADQPADLVSQVQVKTTDLCKSYYTAIGHLQLAAPTLEDEARQQLVTDLAAEVVRIHKEIDGLVDELEKTESSEESQIERIHTLRAENDTLTHQLRERATYAERVRLTIREDLNGLVAELASGV